MRTKRANRAEILSSVVYVAVKPAEAEAVRLLAGREGRSLSSWIRRLLLQRLNRARAQS